MNEPLERGSSQDAQFYLSKWLGMKTRCCSHQNSWCSSMFSRPIPPVGWRLYCLIMGFSFEIVQGCVHPSWMEMSSYSPCLAMELNKNGENYESKCPNVRFVWNPVFCQSMCCSSSDWHFLYLFPSCAPKPSQSPNPCSKASMSSVERQSIINIHQRYSFKLRCAITTPSPMSHHWLPVGALDFHSPSKTPSLHQHSIMFNPKPGI